METVASAFFLIYINLTVKHVRRCLHALKREVETNLLKNRYHVILRSLFRVAGEEGKSSNIDKLINQFAVVQLLSQIISNSMTPWTTACQAFLSSTSSWSLLKFMSMESVMLSHPLTPSSPFAFNLSQHQGKIFH